MGQTRIMSFIESASNTAIGLTINTLANLIVLPMFGLHPTTGDAVGLAAIFTVISIVRSYALRRMFNKGD